MMMQLPGKRVKRTRWVYTDRYVVQVEVDAVILPGEEEASFEPAAVQFLKEVQTRAEAGDRAWLRGVGRLYILDAAA